LAGHPRRTTLIDMTPPPGAHRLVTPPDPTSPATSPATSPVAGGASVAVLAHAVRVRARRARSARLRSAVLRCVPAADLLGPAD
jgi:hypothetical protein